jgi:hypothetical protein
MWRKIMQDVGLVLYIPVHIPPILANKRGVLLVRTSLTMIPVIPVCDEARAGLYI